jgi:hypothetical protein
MSAKAAFANYFMNTILQDRNNNNRFFTVSTIKSVIDIIVDNLFNDNVFLDNIAQIKALQINLKNSMNEEVNLFKVYATDLFSKIRKIYKFVIDFLESRKIYKFVIDFLESQIIDKMNDNSKRNNILFAGGLANMILNTNFGSMNIHFSEMILNTNFDDNLPVNTLKHFDTLPVKQTLRRSARLAAATAKANAKAQVSKNTQPIRRSTRQIIQAEKQLILSEQPVRRSARLAAK